MGSGCATSDVGCTRSVRRPGRYGTHAQSHPSTARYACPMSSCMANNAAAFSTPAPRDMAYLVQGRCVRGAATPRPSLLALSPCPSLMGRNGARRCAGPAALHRRQLRYKHAWIPPSRSRHAYGKLIVNKAPQLSPPTCLCAARAADAAACRGECLQRPSQLEFPQRSSETLLAILHLGEQAPPHLLSADKTAKQLAPRYGDFKFDIRSLACVGSKLSPDPPIMSVQARFSDIQLVWPSSLGMDSHCHARRQATAAYDIVVTGRPRHSAIQLLRTYQLWSKQRAQITISLGRATVLFLNRGIAEQSHIGMHTALEELYEIVHRAMARGYMLRHLCLETLSPTATVVAIDFTTRAGVSERTENLPQ
ncbi:hypothetical protein PSPO01_04609 [Paraphaeosphaeria sporulosa]